MFAGHKISQQTEMIPIRRLMGVMTALKGAKIKETDLLTLPYIDNEIEETKKANVPKFNYSEAEIKEIEAEYRRNKETFLLRRANKKQNKK